MHIAKEDVVVKMEIPGAVIRQKMDFGDATGPGMIGSEYFTLAASIPRLMSTAHKKRSRQMKFSTQPSIRSVRSIPVDGIEG